MADEKPSIESTKNGPYMVKNLENLKNYKGEPLKTFKVMVLCRCGHSGRKPFCDGQHWYVDFKDPVE
jgi:CDGSH-type Zn-finger protein